MLCCKQYETDDLEQTTVNACVLNVAFHFINNNHVMAEIMWAMSKLWPCDTN
jgi:hypothetical protein